MFPPLTIFPICLYLFQTIDKAVWEQATSLATLCVELPSCWNFIIHSIVSADSSLVEAMFPISQPAATAC